MTGRTELETRAENLFRAFAGSVARTPAAHTQFLIALDFALGPTREIVVAGEAEAADTRALVLAARRRYLPRAVILLRQPGEAGRPLARIAPFTQAQGPVGGRAAAYVCENFSCRTPVTDPAALETLLAAPTS
jgi:uncharacterized protein YyaL (SSP411 family)